MAWTAASTFICQDLFTKSNERKHWVFLYLLMLKSLSWAIAEIYFIFTIPYSKYDKRKDGQWSGIVSVVLSQHCSQLLKHQTLLYFFRTEEAASSPVAFGDVFPNSTAAIPGWKNNEKLTPLYHIYCDVPLGKCFLVFCLASDWPILHNPLGNYGPRSKIIRARIIWSRMIRSWFLLPQFQAHVLSAGNKLWCTDTEGGSHI